MNQGHDLRPILPVALGGGLITAVGMAHRVGAW